MTGYTIPQDAYSHLTAALLAGDTTAAMRIVTEQVIPPRDPAAASTKQLWTIAGLMASGKVARSGKYQTLKLQGLTKRQASKIINGLLTDGDITVSGVAYTRADSKVAAGVMAGVGKRRAQTDYCFDDSDIPW